ncbi:phosphotransferase family protein [Mycobacterium sp. URHB0044]|uniref:phosphotransferase family protein n=1 Tax=Mycobacterium sp. URHB0044 TaxID=1380386 RepID=UPI000491F29D|nr:phosphotransferase family protein [Mycobacterium sp. URHB0044]
MIEPPASALAAVLRPSLGDVQIANLRVLTGGASRATWAFDAVTGDASRALILRSGPPDEVHAGMLLEARAQRLAAVAGAPVPEVLVAEESTAALGAPFLIGGFIAGETIPRRILRALDAGDRIHLLEQCAAALAAIHRADLTEADIPAQDQLATWREWLDEMGDTTATFEWTIRWLAMNRPPPTQRVLVHGDFRMGNLIIDTDAAPANLAAVLDWELTHTGEAAEDLAWFCIRAWRFGAASDLGAGGLGSIDDFLAAYEAAGGAAVDRTAFRWWLVLATLRWGVICRYQAHRHLSGQNRSVELAAIGRRVCETEFDLLQLLEQAS